MASEAVRDEVHENYQAFKKLLPELLVSMPDKFVVMHHRQIERSFDTFAEAVGFGYRTYGRDNFSVQEVTDRVISFGAQTYALHSDPH